MSKFTAGDFPQILTSLQEIIFGLRILLKPLMSESNERKIAQNCLKLCTNNIILKMQESFTLIALLVS